MLFLLDTQHWDNESLRVSLKHHPGWSAERKSDGGGVNLPGDRTSLPEFHITEEPSDSNVNKTPLEGLGE